MIKALRGMKDIIDDSDKFTAFIDKATQIAKNFSFSYIETPLLEETRLFKRSVGESSDIVNKEMYQFIDKGGNDVCLRPEGTAGVVRAYIQKKYDSLQTPKQWYYYGPMFRYERPQKGRLREFHQFGVESFGEGSVYEDVKVILMASKILDSFGIAYTLKINSLGCDECRPRYTQNLVNFLENVKEELCEDCQRRITQNPIRTLDCKNEKCQNILKDAPRITYNLCDECNKDFELLKQELDKLGIKYEVDTSLVRGLDYYNKTAFEFVSDEIGAQSAICGGGRYDKLVEMLDGKSVPAVGFAMGIERLLPLINTQTKRDGVYIGIMTEDARDMAMKKFNQLVDTQKVYFENKVRKLNQHLKRADKMNYKKVLIAGEDEVAKGEFFSKEL
ncbi:MAG: histidine--tRNA ligase [Epsilonproteobacteria bacterium]|nr:histidine--tRNA ligase [Campylobacterota bacterium]